MSERANMKVAKGPCKACPFRKTSAPGFLGGGESQRATDYLRWAHSDDMIACHKSPGYADDNADRMRPCAGAAIYRNNVLKWPRTPDAAKACKEVGNDPEKVVFQSPQEFLDRHDTELNRRFADQMDRERGSITRLTINQR